MTGANDPLLEHLLDLCRELDKDNVPSSWAGA